MSVTSEWIKANREAVRQIIPPGAQEIHDPTNSFNILIVELAHAFALERFGHLVPLRFGQRGLHPDDTASFLRAIDSGNVEVLPNGSFLISSCRRKPGGNRYSLFTANRWNNDFYISLNTENLIHFGAAAELHSAYGWPADQIEVEVGEFDARVWDGDRVVLLMEAKARVDGADSLAPLLRSFLKFSKQPEPPEATGNHSRKYVELLKQTEGGMVLLWLVAAGARWAFKASRVEDRVVFEEAIGPGANQVSLLMSDQMERVMKPIKVSSNVDHAVARALLTEMDTRQRVYEHPWASKDELYGFIAKLKVALMKSGIEHTRPWVWTAETSTGSALTPFGKDTSLELRLSYSPKSS
jgi:hypothetical protein